MKTQKFILNNNVIKKDGIYMKKKITCLLVVITLGLSMIGCGKIPSDNTPKSSTDNTDSSMSPSTSEQDYLDYNGVKGEIAGSRQIAVYENKNNNQVIYIAVSNSSGDTSVAMSNLTTNNEIDSNDDILSYCSELSDIFGSRKIVVYEDRKHSKVVYLAISNSGGDTAIAVSNLTINDIVNSNENILSYDGEQNGIFGSRNVAIYKDIQHKKFVCIGVSNSNSKTSIAISDMIDTTNNK